jgi:malonate-semialdehyde dehydrogenase (acetylating)/methylmalonate-semialdehyde dehydrogenase
MTTELTHFIGGQHVKGTSGRFADVFNPATGEVQAKCPLASAAEVRAAVENAKAAQPGWAAQNPQRRARVMMKFVQLLQRDMDKLAEALSREHGKTIPDAKGDVQRGLEVAEFCIGAPHLLKGEYTESAGPGIDMYSMRQPIGVAAGITPFNFPAMIPMWKFCPALACGNAFILKPSERDPSVPLMLAELTTATRRRSTPSSTTRISALSASSARPRSPITSIHAAPRRASGCSASAAPRTT